MRRLGKPVELIEYDNGIREKILNESVRLFAMKGYASTTVRDIAEAAGVSPRSVYRHYANKRAILDEIFECCHDEINNYYAALDRANEKAKSFVEVVNNLFIELKKITGIFSYYALHIAMTTQFQFESSRNLYYGDLLQKSRRVVREQLDKAVDRGLVQPFDTEGLASFITGSVTACNSLRAGQHNGFYTDFDFNSWYERQVEFILRCVPQNQL